MKKSDIPSTAIDGCTEQLADLLETFDDGAGLLEWLREGGDADMLDQDDHFFDYGFLFGVASAMGVTTEVLVEALLPKNEEAVAKERATMLRVLRKLVEARADYDGGHLFSQLPVGRRSHLIGEAAREMKVDLKEEDYQTLLGEPAADSFGGDTDRKRMLRAVRLAVNLVEASARPLGPSNPAEYREAAITQACIDLDIEITETEREVLR